MVLIQWNGELELGNPAIDAQHKKWVGMLNALNEAMIQGKGKEILGPLLSELIDYTAVHFSTEEHLMQARLYPDRDQHARQHAELKATVGKLQRDYAEERLMITIEVMRFLKDWLYQHIKNTDKRFGEFLARKGAS